MDFFLSFLRAAFKIKEERLVLWKSFVLLYKGQGIYKIRLDFLQNADILFFIKLVQSTCSKLSLPSILFA